MPSPVHVQKSYGMIFVRKIALLRGFLCEGKSCKNSCVKKDKRLVLKKYILQLSRACGNVPEKHTWDKWIAYFSIWQLNLRINNCLSCLFKPTYSALRISFTAKKTFWIVLDMHLWSTSNYVTYVPLLWFVRVPCSIWSLLHRYCIVAYTL